MRTIKTLFHIGLLLSAWIAWFFVLTFLTQLTFTPWDGAIDWPALGTWQRTLNDFFASDPGRLIISIPMIIVSIYLTRSTLRRNPEKRIRIIGLLWLFIPMLLLAWYGSVSLNNALHPYPPVMYDPNYRGFHLTIIPGITLIGLCIVWLVYQSRINYFPRNKS
ncbi:MAG: hypothetical protein ABI690_21750 [Chloroflexota bacterium]